MTSTQIFRKNYKNKIVYLKIEYAKRVFLRGEFSLPPASLENSEMILS